MPTSSESATPSVIIASTQWPDQPSGGGDQPPYKNVPIAETCHDSSLPVIGTQTSAKEKKTEEPKDSTTALVPSPYVTPVPLPHVCPIPSPHTTPIPSPHHSHVSSASATLLQPSGSSIQIVDLGDGKSSSSESTKSNEAVKKTPEMEKGQSSSKLIFQYLKNPFSSIAVIVTLAKRKMFNIESLGIASKVIGIDS